MFKRCVFALFCTVILSAGTAFSQAVGVSEIPPFTLGDKILILAPHPDDESLACAGIIQAALKAGADVHVAYLTSGDHNQFAFIVYEKRIVFRKGAFIHLGQIRQGEAKAAMQLLGLDENRLVFLGYPDSGTFAIFSQYWQADKPFKSLLTRISSVPYKENLSFGEPYVAESILKDLENIILEYRPNKIFVSHSADVNVDHRALYLFLEVALEDIAEKIKHPEVYQYLIHKWGWPKSRRYHPELTISPPEDLSGGIHWYEFKLSPEALEKKHRAILKYRSQTQSSASYLLTFARKNELFGVSQDARLFQDKEAKVKSMGSIVTFSEDAARITYTLQDQSLLIKTDAPLHPNSNYNLDIYLFGYNSKVPFTQMPKIHITTRDFYATVYNGKKRLGRHELVFNTVGETKILKIPLRLLGDPDFILASVRFKAEGLMSTAAFHKLLIREEGD